VAGGVPFWRGRRVRGTRAAPMVDPWSEFRTDVVSGLNPISSAFPTFGRLLWLVLLMA
jgi:hypothetical protein